MQKKAAKISSYLNPLTFLIINLAICLLIYRGGVNVSTGALSQGQVVALYNYMSQILVELIKLANLIITVSRAIACAGRRRYLRCLTMPQEVRCLLRTPRKHIHSSFVMYLSGITGVVRTRLLM